MPRDPDIEVIESTAGQIAAELARRGVPPEQRVMITIEPDDWLTKVRQFARARMAAQGLSDADIDHLIEQERAAVQPRGG